MIVYFDNLTVNMKKSTKNNIVLIVFIGIIASLMIWAITRKGTGPIGSLSLYFRPDCPHCINVEKFITNNGLDKKYDIEMKNIDLSGQYANELMARSQLCGISAETLGVPLLYDSGDCYMGEEEIIDYFRKIN